jgi:hypothetical protein
MLDNWSLLKPITWPKLKKRIDKLHERVNKLVAQAKSEKVRSEAKIRSERLTSANNCSNLPDNVTIREEYVKCGKSGCSRCRHGPYFYAYWKVNEKLNKKYIGKYAPRTDSTGEYKFIRNEFYGSAPSRDINVEPSNSPEVSQMAKGYITKTKNVRATRPRTNKLRQDQI